VAGSAAAYDTGVRAAAWMLDRTGLDGIAANDSRAGAAARLNQHPFSPRKTPKDRPALLEPETETIAAQAYREGCRLLDTVDQSGDRQNALAAVSVFRDALNSVGDNPSLRNGLGAALLALAQLEPHGEALEALGDAVSAFAGAVSEAMRLGAPPATRIRYQINHATALWMLGDRLANDDHILQAVSILHSVITDLSPAALVDWPQAQDNLGNALMALGKPAEAIQAYETAIKGWKDKDQDEAAQSQIHLGTAYTEIERYQEAYHLYREAAKQLTRDRRPMAWSRIQHNLGTALWLEASGPGSPESKQKLLTDAVDALEAARHLRLRQRAAVEWAVTTANLASAKAALGIYLASDLQLDQRIGLGHLTQAVGLYKEALTELTAADAVKTVRKVFVILEFLKELNNQFGGLQTVRDHQIDMLLIARSRNDDNLFDIVKLELENTFIIILSLPSNANILPNMTPGSDIIADLQSVLLSSGIPRTEWPGVLAKVLNPSGTPAASDNKQIEGARTAARAATARADINSSPPPLPTGLTWPTETYSASPEAKRGGGGIVAYLERVWLPLLQSAPGVLDLRTLRAVDPSAAMGVNNHKRGGKLLPAHLHIPTERELNDRALAAFDKPGERPARLDWIARKRAQQAKAS
jgi:tetratricopeptide (TPR) repeat protein